MPVFIVVPVVVLVLFFLVGVELWRICVCGYCGMSTEQSQTCLLQAPSLALYLLNMS